jgi:PAS domain S-box-containing protein
MGTGMNREDPGSLGRARSVAIDALGSMIAIVDRDGRYRCVSDSYAAWLGRDRAEIEGRPVADVLPSGILNEIAPYVARALAGEPVEREIALRTPHRRTTHLAFRYVPEFRDGVPNGFIAVVSDLSDHRRIEERLAIKDAITRSLWEARSVSEAAPGVLGALGRYLDSMASALWLASDEDQRMRCECVEAADEALRARFSDACGDLRFARGEGVIGGVWESGAPVFRADIGTLPEFVRADFARSEGLTSILAFPIALDSRGLGVIEFFLREDEPPEPGILTMLAAIASQLAQFVERLRIERVLRESEWRLMLLTDLVPQLIWSADRHGEVDFYSSRHTDYAGFSRNEDGSWNWTPVIHPDDVAPTVKAWDRAVRTGASYEIEHRIAGVDGSFRWHLSRALPLRDESGAITRWYGSATDIHALKSAQAEAERLLSERQAILETMAQGLAVIAPDGNFTYFNPAGRRMLGWSDPEPPALTDAAWIALDPRTLDGGPLLPHLMPHAAALRGERVRSQMVRVAHPKGSDVILSCDGEPLRDAAGVVTGAILTFDDVTERQAAEARLRDSEARLKATFEGVTDAIITFGADGRIISFNHAYARMHGFASPEDAPSHRDLYKSELEVRTPDGRPVPIEEWPFSRALRGEVVKDLELHFSRRGAGEVFIGSFNATPITGPDGEILQVVVTIRDITERSRARRRHDLMTREVNHRARNALAVVQAITRLTRAETVREYGEAVRGRVEALVRSHVRLADNEWDEVPLRELILDELRPYQSEDGQRVTLEGSELHLAPEAVQPVSMALHELATNAAKHGALSQPEGRIRVKVEPLGGTRFQLVWTEEGGPAAAPPTRRGVGLEVIGSVASQLDGTCDIAWTPSGLRCTLTLGLGATDSGTHHRSDQPEAPPVEAGPGPMTRHRVLVVEDDALIAADVAATLGELGYDAVGPAATLEEAFQLAEAETGLSAALLDVNVGGTMSWPLAEALKDRGVPVIFASGYAPDGSGGPDAEHLQKPYTSQQLDHALKRALATVEGS